MEINSFFKKYSLFLSIIFLIGLSFFAVRPLLLPGFFPMHDDTQPARIFEMANALQDGMFPVRWSKDLGYGYGYPLFNFYAPFVYYIGGLIHMLGVDAVTTTKLVMALGLTLSGLAMYLFAKDFWGNLGGLLSGALYLLVPYHAVNIYVRGDMAEFWASVFIPVVFWGLYRIYLTKQWRYVVIAGLSYAVIIASHNLTGLMVSPFIILFALVLIVSSRFAKITMLYIAMACLSGMLMAAFYWLPVFAEMKYTNILSQIGGKADFSLHFVCPWQLWDSPWGFGGSASGCIDGMSFRLGKLHIVLSIFSFIGTFVLIKKYKKQFVISSGMLLAVVFSLWLTIDASQPLWRSISYMSYFQYPWRFLLMAAFFSSVLGGGIMWVIEVLFKKFPFKNLLVFGLLALLLCAGVFLYGKLFQPQTIIQKSDRDYTSPEALKWTISKISDEYLPKGFKRTDSATDVVTEQLAVLRGKAVIHHDIAKTQFSQSTITASSPSIIHFRLAYFPAWRLQLDGHDLQYTVTNNGILFSMTPGRHVFVASYVQTMVEKLADILSLAGVAVLFLAIIFKRPRPVAQKHHANKKTIS